MAIRATAWRMITSDTSAVAAVEDTAIPAPDECKPFDGAAVWPGGYIRSLEMRVAEGHRPGAGIVWLRTQHPLTDKADSGDLSRLMGLVDTANGIAARVPPARTAMPSPTWTFRSTCTAGPKANGLAWTTPSPSEPTGLASPPPSCTIFRARSDAPNRF
ncbi:conserved hypothetical protein [Arthrobacter sp. Hiyo4]|nr:conserved hypothetical protein [Arthrobacter sp. Hiyo4]